LIFAEWSKAYLQYLDNSAPGRSMDVSKAAFMTMREFGPFDIGDANHQAVLSPIGLALITELSITF